MTKKLRHILIRRKLKIIKILLYLQIIHDLSK